MIFSEHIRKTVPGSSDRRARKRIGLSTEAAKAQADELGIELELCKADGEELMHGERIGTLVAAAKQVALAEERMIGALAKASGIATAARTAVLMADGRAEIVSGSWKRCRHRSRSLYAVLF
ncbi:hypothetical protein M5E87_11610 [Flavonifractor plautii]|nr:hypothetical protein M5E87_11610 [Flavonifractor plautii]